VIISKATPPGAVADATDWPTRFALPDGLDLAALLRVAYDPAPKPPARVRQIYYDTHVWSLWFQDVALFSEDRQTFLRRRAGEWLGEQLGEIAVSEPLPRFASEWPESAFRRQIEPLLGLRTLRKVAAARLRRQEWALRDEAGKTVVRLFTAAVESASPDRPAALFAELAPLLGYEAEAREASRLLRSVAVDPARGPLGEGFRAAGVEPMPYSIKPAFRFSPAQPARDILREAALRVFSIARFNEAGIIDDADTEFLHDYRVCIRKVRSLLSSLEGVFPDVSLLEWKTRLGDLARATNRLRDLDVHLLSREEMIRVLPPPLRPGLDAFFADLADERAAEFRRVRARLRNRRYQAETRDLEASLSAALALPKARHSDLPIGQAAARRIARRFRRIAKLARGLHHETPDHEIHGLRIQCKKLRYLLEFFGLLFPEEFSAPLSRQLSKLQNCLGRFNDTSVQQSYLFTYWRSRESSGDTRLAMSLGGLITSLHHEHAAMRQAVEESLLGFCGPKNSERVERLLACGEALSPGA